MGCFAITYMSMLGPVSFHLHVFMYLRDNHKQILPLLDIYFLNENIL